METVDLDQQKKSNDEEGDEIVSPDGTKLNVSERDSIRFEPHPNTIFAAKAEEKETESGIILPDSVNDKNNPTPIAKVLAVGENVAKQFAETGFNIEKGDLVYVDPQFMRFAKIDGVAGLILMADGILGKLPKNEE